MKTIVKSILAAGAFGILPSIFYSDIRFVVFMILGMSLFWLTLTIITVIAYIVYNIMYANINK